jgi:hypothetical protein
MLDELPLGKNMKVRTMTDARSPIADMQWHRLDSAAVAEHSEIVSAVAAFVVSDTVRTDQDAKNWLRDDALSAYPRVVTYLAFKDGAVEGFFALTTVHVALTVPRRRLFLGRTRLRDSLQEAVMITALARRRDASLSERDMLLQIIGTVLADPRWINAIALLAESGTVVSPEFLEQNHFQPLEDSESGDLFWFPLEVFDHPTDPGLS